MRLILRIIIRKALGIAVEELETRVRIGQRKSEAVKIHQ